MPVRLDGRVKEPKLPIILLDGADLPVSDKVSLRASNIPAMELNRHNKATLHKPEQLAVQLRMQYEECVCEQ